MTNTLLTINTGSSSIKFVLFSLQSDSPFLAGGKVSGIGSTPVFSAHRKKVSAPKESLPLHVSHDHAIDIILQWLIKNREADWKLAGVVHRIVHGGPKYTQPVKITPEVLDYLRTLNPLAPLHQPHNLTGVDIFMRKKADLPQFGCFDTAFHAHHLPIFQTMAIPEKFRSQGVRRYGFHGLSYEWISKYIRKEYPHLSQKRVVIAHLGNGASLCALKDGVSVDTTMGMTALEGLPMGTRCGSIDPGALLYMQREFGLSTDQLEQILYKESGLKGLSGLTNDVQELLQSSKPDAHFALDYFALKTAQFIASMAVSIGGLDALIFTGGIGENEEAVRTNILNHLRFMPAYETHIIPTNEERCMAQEIQHYFGKELQS
jgi:acetate kinase